MRYCVVRLPVDNSLITHSFISVLSVIFAAKILNVTFHILLNFPKSPTCKFMKLSRSHCPLLINVILRISVDSGQKEPLNLFFIFLPVCTIFQGTQMIVAGRTMHKQNPKVNGIEIG